MGCTKKKRPQSNKNVNKQKKISYKKTRKLIYKKKPTRNFASVLKCLIYILRSHQALIVDAEKIIRSLPPMPN